MFRRKSQVRWNLDSNDIYFDRDCLKYKRVTIILENRKQKINLKIKTNLIKFTPGNGAKILAERRHTLPNLICITQFNLNN